MARKQTPRQRRAHDRKRKKRETQKRKAKVQSIQSRTPLARMHRAGAAPLLECRVSEGWQERGYANLLIAREGPEGIAAGVFFVDLGCLGVKSCFAVPDYTWEEYRNLLTHVEETDSWVACDPALARKLVETGVDYAEELGFQPNKDYRLAREIFGDIDTACCSEVIRCGENGRPVYVQGPDDDMRAILNQLEASVGADGFDYIHEENEPSPPSLRAFICGLEGSPEWFDEEEDAAAPEVDLPWRRLRRREGKLVGAILKDALERYDPALLQEAWGEFSCWDDDRLDSSEYSEFFPFFADWLTFAWRPDLDDLILRDEEEGIEDAEWGLWPDQPLARAYLKMHSDGLDTFEKRFLTEITRPPFSFYAVVRVLPDRGLVLEDILMQRRVEVRERSLTRCVKPGAILFARVFEQEVTSQGGTESVMESVSGEPLAIICGCGPIPIPPIYRGEIVDLREWIGGGLGRVDAEALHECDIELRDAYFDMAEKVQYPQLPQIVNTDGESVVPTRLQFAFHCSPQEALQKLAPLALDQTLSELQEEAEMDDGGELHAVQIPWLKQGNRKHRDWPSTVLGSLSIEGQQLVAEVNSQSRAERIRGEIEKLLGEQVHYESCVTEPLEMALSTAGAPQRKRRELPLGDMQEESDAIASFPGVQEQLREHMAGHWEAWFDEPIPVLRDQTPREAARTSLGRELLEALLHDYEWSHERQPDAFFAPDVAALRNKLGL